MAHDIRQPLPRIAGLTPAARQEAAKLLVELDRQEGKTTDRYIMDVAEGRVRA